MPQKGALAKAKENLALPECWARRLTDDFNIEIQIISKYVLNIQLALAFIVTCKLINFLPPGLNKKKKKSV